MNFFEAQDEARRASRRLVFAYIIATVLIVASVAVVVSFVMFILSDSAYRGTFGSFLSSAPGIPISVALVTALFVVGASVAKSIELSASGGGRIARQMGGTLVSADARDPLRPYTDQATLTVVDAFLRKRISPFVKLEVQNPKFEEVQVKFRVAFTPEIGDIAF